MEDIILLDILPKVLPMLTAIEKKIEKGGITIILLEKAITMNKDITKKQSLTVLLLKYLTLVVIVILMCI